MGWEAEFAAHDGTMGKNDNKVWRDFRRNPQGRGHPFFDFRARLRCRSSLEDVQYSSLLAPKNPEKLAPAAAYAKVHNRL
jgi:hypothetical protein